MKDTSLKKLVQQSGSSVVLAVGNIFEFNEKHNTHLPIPELIDKRLRKPNFAVSAEMALFWGGTVERRIVILPSTPNKSYVEYLSNRFGVSITCFVPQCETGWVSRDLLYDHETLEQVVHEIGTSEVIIIPWGATSYLDQLIATLTEYGVNIQAQLCPMRESRRIGDYIDSKVGGRSILEQVATHFPNLGVPPGYVCAGREDAAEVAFALSHHNQWPLVLKSDRGAGGRGIRMFLPSAPEELNRYTPSDFMQAMSDDEYWKDALVIVEAAIGGGAELLLPTFEGIVGSDGVVVSRGTGNCLVNGHQYYVGIELGYGALPEAIATRIEQIGLAVGEKIASMGYSGWYDVDFLAPTLGDMIYGSEINARLTGPVFAMEAMTRMHGHTWREEYYVHVHERLWLDKPLADYEVLSEALIAVGESAGDDCGILPIFTSGASLAEPYLGYIVYAPSKSNAAELEAKLWRKLPVKFPVIGRTSPNEASLYLLESSHGFQSNRLNTSPQPYDLKHASRSGF